MFIDSIKHFCEGENMKVSILYFSRYGNGKKCMGELKGMLEERECQVEMNSVNDMDPGKLPEADIYVFSTPTEAFGIAGPMKGFLKKMSPQKGAKYALFDTHALAKPRATPKMEKLLRKKGMTLVAKADTQVGGKGKDVSVQEGYQEQLKQLADKIAPK
jgi:flavodoxin